MAYALRPPSAFLLLLQQNLDGAIEIKQVFSIINYYTLALTSKLIMCIDGHVRQVWKFSLRNRYVGWYECQDDMIWVAGFIMYDDVTSVRLVRPTYLPPTPPRV